MEYRHELKFEVSEIELEKMKYRISSVMEKDYHTKGDYYTVRSLYFDDMYDNCLNEIDAGTDRRQKYRIRIYNDSAYEIHLEKKTKYHGMTRKNTEIISLADCMAYMNGQIVEGKGRLSEELYCNGLMSGMRPKCIVEYDRYAYTEAAGNVRITFDTYVRGSMDTGLFLDSQTIDYIPAMPSGRHILEVKYDELLPEYILRVMDLNCLQRQSISKYAYVRKSIVDKRKGLL